ncbi:MAG: ATP-dependent metallopeptidase FtsH/Yme1/Tma family protein [Deltaproteobacteria bacterium]|nr:ATP-dependent metallopeptidase FtsH/Yme1/Tma family protein [Deltaproteobacteria bacterium]
MALFIRTIFALVMLIVLGGAAAVFWNMENRLQAISYNEFLTALEKNEITEVRLRDGQLSLKDTFGREFVTYSPAIPSLLPKLLEKGVIIYGSSDKSARLLSFAQLLIPVMLILLVWYSLLRNQPPGDGELDDKDKLKRFSPQEKHQQVTFRNVAGVPEAKEELLEVIDFLQRPKKYSKLGAVIPRGILFQGPPGTGKTLLARAIAGEAGVPFFSISGSDFVEMFVGVGAARVRDLFKEAKKQTPCIVFIDEIDAVGGRRSSGNIAGGQDERGQTLNALLVEMDGFSSEETIIILAATNRPDILDPALLRPGRFDRQINILPPDIKGRLQILQVYGQKMKLAEDMDLEKVARSTPGFTGAELASLMNEAALIAGRMGDSAIRPEHFEIAKDRILMGVERKGLVISEKDRKTMAYHEAGHAVLAKFLPETDPIHKITIIPRGRALGHTQQLPLADRHAYPKEYLLSRIKILMGGRVAEEICLNQQTTGAEDDFRQAIELATKMVCQWGMSENIGPMSYMKDDGAFLGEQLSRTVYSEETGQSVDREVKRLVESCYREARKILTAEKDFLIYLADMLLVNETLDQEEMEIIYECTSKKRKEGSAAKSPGDGMACAVSSTG